MGVGRRFAQTKDAPYESMKFARDLTLPNLNTWQEQPLGNFRRLSSDLAQNPEAASQKCFVFNVDGIRIWLPKFELARKLFFHAGFLTRAAFVPNGLDLMFSVEKDEELRAITIKTLDSVGVPAMYFRHKDYRQFFAWLLLNPEAKRSFESIWQHLNQEQVHLENYFRWKFNFTPPDFLSGMKITAQGQFNSKHSEMLIWEIAALHKLPLDVIEEIRFFHPKIKRPIRGTADGGGKPESSDGLEVDDDEDTDENKSGEFIEMLSESLGYSNQIETRLIFNGNLNTGSGAKDESERGKLGDDVVIGTKDPVVGGELPPGDLEQLKEEENLQKYLNRFTALYNLILQISKEQRFTYLGVRIKPLPAVKNHSFHMRDASTKRCYLMAGFKLKNGTVRYILDIDTSDNKRQLSTKVFHFKPDIDEAAALEDILAKTVKARCWANNALKNHCEGIREVSHPKATEDAREQEVLGRSWKSRLKEALRLFN